MGSKGSNTTTTNQTQTYQPNQQAASAITGALGQAQSAAQLPFNIPQAPVAGFSQDQQNAFSTVNNAQGMAQPYFNQASNLFNQSAQGPDISQFFNPYASAVTSQLNNIFGQQQSQNNGSLVQAAGGVGADRIAVGQSQLANQQGLAAGQTLAGLYAPSLSAAQQQQQIQQGAGYGIGALGPAAQNAAFSGAQAQLGTGGLQQQLSQAQMNSPYQQQLAQAAFPYQQSQFLTGAVGSLAPGLGGTTSGQGQTTTPAPSMLSQILGLGTAGVGAVGASGGFGSNGWLSNAFNSNAQPNTGAINNSMNTLSNNTGGNYYGPGFARGGDVNPYYDDGGGIPNDKPINVDQQSIIPTGKTPSIQPHIPQLNLSTQAPAQQNAGADAGQAIASAAKIAMMFAARGGRINPYANGGRAFADGGDTDEPFRMPGQAAMDAWRKGVDADMGAGTTATNADGAPTGGDNPYVPSQAMAFSGDTPEPTSVRAIRKAAGASPPPPASEVPQDVKTLSRPAAAAALPAPTHDSGSDFAKSPWAALMQAGLAIAGGTSPFAAVNIGQGGQQGLKTLQAQHDEALKDQTVAQAAKRLQMEAQHHEDQFTRMTPYQKWETGKPVPGGQVYDPNTGLTRNQMLVSDGKGGWKPASTGESTSPPVDPATGEPVKPLHQKIGDGIVDGTLPPTFSNLGRMAAAVKGYTQDKHFDVTKAELEYKAALKQVQSLNGPQMQRGYQLSRSVNSTIDEVQQLSEQMKLGGIPFMNSLELQKYIRTQGNTEKGQLATQYMTAVNTLKEEFANLANGGYAPTEPAWALANEQVNGTYGMKQLGASLNEIKRLINYRMGFMQEGNAPGAANRYTGNPGTTAPAATPAATPAAPAAAKVDPAVLRSQAEAAIKLNPTAHDQIVKHLQEQGGDATGL